jgi:hypothetical protein
MEGTALISPIQPDGFSVWSGFLLTERPTWADSTKLNQPWQDIAQLWQTQPAVWFPPIPNLHSFKQP